MWIYKLILFSLFFISCSLDIPDKDNYLRWTTNFEIPLNEQKIHLGSLSDDSDISIKPLGDFFPDSTPMSCWHEICLPDGCTCRAPSRTGSATGHVVVVVLLLQRTMQRLIRGGRSVIFSQLAVTVCGTKHGIRAGQLGIGKTSYTESRMAKKGGACGRQECSSQHVSQIQGSMQRVFASY